jgi:hypothetical protein
LESVNAAGGVARGSAGEPGANGGDGRGGAVFNEGTLHVVASTLYDNRAIGGTPGAGGTGGLGLGGAVFNADGTLSIRNATLSGNQALNGLESPANAAFGGGIYGINGSLAIYNSTITASTAATGRGVYLVAVANAASAVIHSSIIAQADDSQYDLYASQDAGGTISVDGGNNLIRWLNDFVDIAIPEFVRPEPGDPLLAALADNGGPTLTHALAANSPALGRGANPLSFATDQRGSSFAREVGGGVDVGAFESSLVAPELPGDYNRDHSVSAADYVLWRKFVNHDVAPHELADGDGSGHIDDDDYAVWENNFGEELPAESETPGLPGGQPIVLSPAVYSERGMEQPFDPGELTSICGKFGRRVYAPLTIEASCLNDSAHDKALLTLLTTWDGLARGRREPLGFE